MKARLMVFAVLVVATLLAGLAATVAPPPGDAPRVNVPIGSLGDEATYHVSGVHASFYLDEHYGGAPSEESMAFQVSGIEDIIDQHGVGRKVVRTYLSGMQLADGTTHQRTEYVDLETRDIVRVDTDRQEIDGSIGKLSWFGPLFTNTPFPEHGLTRFAHSNQTYLRFSGRTFAMGDDLTAQRGPGILADVEDFGTPRTWSVSSRVDRYGSYEGATVLGVTDQWDVSEPEVGRRELGQQVTWISPTIPYPVLIERQWRKELQEDWWETDNKTSTLLSWEPAQGTAIPWKPATRVAASVEWSRSPVWLPDEGTGSRLPLKIVDASNAVVGDLTLDGFAAWRQENPGWQLVGFDMRPGPALGYNDLPGHLVELTYAAPGGDTAYRVRSTYVDALLPPRNDSGRIFALASPSGDFRLPSAAPATAAVTWSHVDSLWKQVGQPEMTANAPDRVVWGYAQVGECGKAGAMSACGLFSPQEALSLVRWGRDRGLYEPAGPQNVEFDVIDLAIHDNRLIHAWRGDGPGVADPLFAPADPVPVLKLSAPQTSPVVPASDAALLAAGAIALAAIVLWAGTLKTWLAKTLALAGFSRLKEPDVVGHPTRDAIVQAVTSTPGLNATQIAATMPAAGWSTVVYHLGVLVRHGQLDVVADGRHRRHFVHDVGASTRARQTALMNPRTRLVHGMLAQGSGLTRQQIAERLGISVQGVSWHLDRLVGVGLVQAAGQRPVRYRAADGSSVPA